MAVFFCFLFDLVACAVVSFLVGMTWLGAEHLFEDAASLGRVDWVIACALGYIIWCRIGDPVVKFLLGIEEVEDVTEQ